MKGFANWLLTVEDKQNKVKNILDGQNLILFFTKDDGIFGAPEESRVVFAKMKNPDEDMPDGWADEAQFMATDLIKAMMGDKTDNIFGAKDLKSIRIQDRDAIEKLLMHHHCEEKPSKIKQSPEGVGIIKLKDFK